jgi:hypothetical protein
MLFFMNLLAWPILLIGALVWLCAAALTFRHGARQRFISAIPLATIALWTIGLSLLPTLRDLLEGRPTEDWLIATAVAAGLFVAACVIWLMGFFFGRVRAARRDGIVRSR